MTWVAFTVIWTMVPIDGRRKSVEFLLIVCSTELSVGPFRWPDPTQLINWVTQPNPTHQLSDPTQPDTTNSKTNGS